MNESDYTEGSRRACINMLQLCLQNLGVDDPVAEGSRWVLERQETLAVLRRICETYGDNEWDDDLHLADIIEKHLARYLEDASPEPEDH